MSQPARNANGRQSFRWKSEAGSLKKRKKLYGTGCLVARALLNEGQYSFSLFVLRLCKSHRIHSWPLQSPSLHSQLVRSSSTQPLRNALQ